MPNSSNKESRYNVYKREGDFHDDEYFEREKISFLYDAGATSTVINQAYKLMGNLKDKVC